MQLPKDFEVGLIKLTLAQPQGSPISAAYAAFTLLLKASNEMQVLALICTLLEGADLAAKTNSKKESSVAIENN